MMIRAADAEPVDASYSRLPPRWAHAQQGIRVGDVLREVPISRRWLEARFRKFLGRSPAQEIRRVRLQTARDLLARSDLSIEQVAAGSGFAGATRLGVAFREQFGRTPLAYRKQLHAGLPGPDADLGMDEGVTPKRPPLGNLRAASSV